MKNMFNPAALLCACPKSGTFVNGCRRLLFVHRFSMFYIVLWLDGVGVFTHISKFRGHIKLVWRYGYLPIVEGCLVTFLCIIFSSVGFGSLYHRHLPHISFLPIYFLTACLLYLCVRIDFIFSNFTQLCL